MASRDSIDGGDAGTQDPYLAAWAELASRLEGGSSWSGRERHCLFINRGDGRFVDASFPAGFDLIEDGRALALSDWDDDGDLDVWLRHRNGPQLRFLRNDAPTSTHWLQLRLIGKRQRDAVGAIVEVETERRRHVVERRLGQGYLAQSSARLFVGLGDAKQIRRVEVRWPAGATERFEGVGIDGNWRLVEGRGRAERIEANPRRIADGPVEPTQAPDSAPVLLKTPLPLPPTWLKRIGHTGRPMLLSLWAHWCAPCAEELTALEAADARLRQTGLDWKPACVDTPDDRDAARRFLAQLTADSAAFEQNLWFGDDDLEWVDAVHQHVLGPQDALPVPASWLLDGEGRLQAIYLGATTPDRFVADYGRFVAKPPPGSRRSFFPGRWYFRSRRDLRGFATELKRRGLVAFAESYALPPAPRK